MQVYVFNIWRSAKMAEAMTPSVETLHTPFQGTAPFTAALEHFVRIFVADPPTQEVRLE